MNGEELISVHVEKDWRYFENKSRQSNLISFVLMVKFKIKAG